MARFRSAFLKPPSNQTHSPILEQLVVHVVLKILSFLSYDYNKLDESSH